jgi:hypothetical protein
MSDRLWSSAAPLRSVRLSVLTDAGFRRAEGDERALVWVPTEGAGLESRLVDLAESPRDLVVAAVPGGHFLCDKRRLWMCLVRSLGRTRAHRIMPPSWIPEDAVDRARLHAAHQPGMVYLLKRAPPEDRDEQSGSGVRVLADIDAAALDEAQRQECIVQRRVQDQLEVAGQRFSLRCWVALYRRRGEVQANLHQEGLLTCTPNGGAGPAGAPERLSELYGLLRAAGVSPEPLQSGIVRGVKGCVSAALPELSGPALPHHACVELFGVDFVVDRSLQPWVLGWNRFPDLEPRREGARGLREDVWRASLALAGLPGLGGPDGFLPIGRWRDDARSPTDLPPVGFRNG